MANFIGKLIGHYSILEELGEGGMATVFKARDDRSGNLVAVKIIRVDTFPPAMLSQIIQRFEREIQVTAGMEHSNIIQVLDYGENEGYPFLVMPYLKGGALKDRLGKPLPWKFVVRFLLPVADALSYAHQHGSIHRDVKPSNILLNARGEPVLSDFGIAKLMEWNDGHTLTGTGIGIGTPEYMSPEQGLGKKIDPRSDVYSLGVVMYEMVTGQTPYVGATPMELALKHINEPLPKPRSVIRGLPPAVERVMLKALAKKPEDRFQSMQEFATALTRLRSAPPPVKRVGWLKWAVGGVAAVLVTGLVAMAMNILQLGFGIKPASTLPLSTLTPAALVSSTSVGLVQQQVAASPIVLQTAEGAGKTAVRELDGMEMLFVPAGPAIIGSDISMQDAGNANPQHIVTVADFWIDKTEVTNAMYQRCVKSGACTGPIPASSSREEYYGNPQYDEWPVVNVNWLDAQAYCAWTGGRLPTEAEWEKAARGVDARPYPWGNGALDCSLANTFIEDKSGGNSCQSDTVRVGSYPAGASPYGVLDLIGNVMEWVYDWYDEGYYANSPTSNPSGPLNGTFKLTRGGSWVFTQPGASVFNRSQYFTPGTRSFEIGFRCVLAGAGQPEKLTSNPTVFISFTPTRRSPVLYSTWTPTSAAGDSNPPANPSRTPTVPPQPTQTRTSTPWQNPSFTPTQRNFSSTPIPPTPTNPLPTNPFPTVTPRPTHTPSPTNNPEPTDAPSLTATPQPPETPETPVPTRPTRTPRF